MKKLIVSFVAALAIIACSQNDSPVETMGSLSFIVNGSGPSAGSGWTADLRPEKVIVSIEDTDGKVILDNKVFDLISKEGAYTTEVLPFDAGNYRITKYLVISGSAAAYAAPRSGAQKAGLIDKPLPIDFVVVPTQTNSVAPTIIGIASQDSPQLFGYNDFGYEVPGSGLADNWLNIRVKLEITVGGIYYPNVDANFEVRGFDESNALVWRQAYNYTGPESNDLKIKNGFHHYTIEAQKWGKTLSQTYSLASLVDIKVKEGQIPATQVFQTEIDAKKVTSTTTRFSKIVNGEVVLVPTNKTTYEYEPDGRISLIHNYAWDNKGQQFVSQSQSEFFYQGNQLKQITATLEGSEAVYEQDLYTYDDQNNVTHIQHKGQGLIAEVDFTHSSGDRLVNVAYRFSNGNGFEYEFLNQYGSMKSDKTTKGSELCSTGDYTSDKNINPLKHLGYTDYLIRNYSISNKVTESANYIACAFPALIPETYNYIYTEDGYPIRATTHFKGVPSTSEVEYTYAN
jgi:hypothetical protein